MVPREVVWNETRATWSSNQLSKFSTCISCRCLNKIFIMLCFSFSILGIVYCFCYGNTDISLILLHPLTHICLSLYIAKSCSDFLLNSYSIFILLEQYKYCPWLNHIYVYYIEVSYKYFSYTYFYVSFKWLYNWDIKLL